MNKNSLTTQRPTREKPAKKLEMAESKLKGTGNNRHNLNLSQSSRVVDWSDKLKHMEIKDVMDIDIGHMTEEIEAADSSQG